MNSVIHHTFCTLLSKLVVDKTKMSYPVIYKNAQSILDYLQKPEIKSKPAINELLKIYNKKKSDFEQNVKCKKHPLIILEGLDGSGKSTAVKKVANALCGLKWQTPPESINHLRGSLDEDKEVRTAFYSLGNYIASFEVQLQLHDSPVVMDRYWHSTAAYALAQAAHDAPDVYKMPPKGDQIYEWPEDLFKPDKVIFIDVSEENRLIRISSRVNLTKQEKLLRDNYEFRNNVIMAYKNMINPSVEFIDGNKFPNKTKNAILSRINV